MRCIRTINRVETHLELLAPNKLNIHKRKGEQGIDVFLSRSVRMFYFAHLLPPNHGVLVLAMISESKHFSTSIRTEEAPISIHKLQT